MYHITKPKKSYLYRLIFFDKFYAWLYFIIWLVQGIWGLSIGLQAVVLQNIAFITFYAVFTYLNRGIVKFYLTDVTIQEEDNKATFTFYRLNKICTQTIPVSEMHSEIRTSMVVRPRLREQIHYIELRWGDFILQQYEVLGWKLEELKMLEERIKVGALAQVSN